MSALTVKYFMWSYQPHFQLSAQGSAQNLFKQLLPELDTSLFLVGIKMHEQEDRLPACVEPDHCEVQPEAFDSIENEFQKAINDDDRSQMLYSHPDAAQRVNLRIQKQSLARAIETCCSTATGQESRFFIASDPIEVDCYAVSCVVNFDRDTYESQQVFSDEVIDRVPVERSLIQAVAHEFLQCCRDALREEEAGANLCVVKASTEELLRRGGQRFINSIGRQAFGIEGMENAYGLCGSMNAISAMYYEGSTAAGRFILRGRQGIQENIQGVQFIESISLRDSRRLRKLLELTRDDFSLIVADKGVIGITDKQSAQSGLSIDIPGHRHWRVLNNGKVICEFRYGTPSLPQPKLEEHEFAELCSRLLPANADITLLWQAAKSCMEQSHGTMMVISSRSELEAQRLSRQSTTIKPRILTDKDVAAVSSIDGAILFDHEGVCHSIGVILDGLVTAEGDPARGARYNSAVRYLSGHEKDCIILVVSEDGDITLLPKLHPRVNRQSVQDAVDALFQAAKETPIRPRVYAEALCVLDDLRFYLLPEQCEQLNSIVEATERKLDEEGRTSKVIRPEYVPSPKMNNSYFLPDDHTV